MNIKNIINENKLIKNPYNIFFNFIENNNIILDDDFENLNNWYNNYIENNIIDYKINKKYLEYVKIFENYMKCSNKKFFNYIFYILILFYISEIKLNNFIRFFISNVNKLKNINELKKNNIIKNWINNDNKNKNFNLLTIKNLINIDDIYFFIFLISFQNYFI
jgi:hypothetical protein